MVVVLIRGVFLVEGLVGEGGRGVEGGADEACEVEVVRGAMVVSCGE